MTIYLARAPSERRELYSASGMATDGGAGVVGFGGRMPMMFDDLFDDRRYIDVEFPSREVAPDLTQITDIADVVALAVRLANGVGKYANLLEANPVDHSAHIAATFGQFHESIPNLPGNKGKYAL